MDCDISAPHVIDMGAIGLSSDVYLIGFYRDDVDPAFVSNEFTRVVQYFSEPFFKQVNIGDLDAQNESINLENRDRFVNCQLLKSTNKSFVALVDKKGRIRSYYDCSKRQEFDRMITELEILKEFEL